jgi:hypothetical protein
MEVSSMDNFTEDDFYCVMDDDMSDEEEKYICGNCGHEICMVG